MDELARSQKVLLERIKDYEDTYRMSGHPAICNRIAELHEIVCIIQKRIKEIEPIEN